MPKPDAAATLPRALVLPLPACCLAALVAGVAPALVAGTDSATHPRSTDGPDHETAATHAGPGQESPGDHAVTGSWV